MRGARCAILPLFVAVCAAVAVPHLHQQAYVWQRAWTGSVTNAVTSLAAAFDEVIVLQAEVAWKEGTPKCTKVGLDYAALRSTGRPTGLALRIANFSGPFSLEDPHTTYLADLCKTLVSDATTHQLDPVELQLDFDCAESKLDGYRVWLVAIRKSVHPLPVTITALPLWLNQPAFRGLASAADGYVLQVHSLERPRGPDVPLTICDPEAARRAVSKAAEIGRPFRVALPTYGYLAAFDSGGRFLGLSAEGPARSWPASAQLIPVRSDPIALSGLVREWSTNRPSALVGLVWYRLPVPDDVLNWRWPTLQAVMAGRPATVELRVHVRRIESGLVEIELMNEGTADAERLPVVSVRWDQYRRIAADAVGGYQLLGDKPMAARFQPGMSGQRLPAGVRRTIGWIRFDGDAEVNAELHEIQD